MHCWEYFSYIFSILLSSWFMLSSSVYFSSFLRSLSLHAHRTQQDHKTYRWFCFCAQGVKSSSAVQCTFSEMEPIARLYCWKSIGGALYAQLWKITTAKANRCRRRRRKETRLEKWSKKSVFFFSNWERDKSIFNWLHSFTNQRLRRLKTLLHFRSSERYETL